MIKYRGRLVFLLTVMLVGGILICTGCKKSTEEIDDREFVIEFTCSASPGQQNGVNGVSYSVTLLFSTPSGNSYNITNATISFWEDENHTNGRQDIAVPNALTTQVQGFQTTDFSFVEFVPDTESNGVNYTLADLAISFVKQGVVYGTVSYTITADITW
jgi:hypothetical protein